MQIKTTLTCHHTLFRMTVIKKSDKCRKECGEEGPLFTAVGVKTSVDIIEICLEVPQKVKNRTTNYDPAISVLGVDTKDSILPHS